MKKSIRMTLFTFFILLFLIPFFSVNAAAEENTERYSFYHHRGDNFISTVYINKTTGSGYDITLNMRDMQSILSSKKVKNAVSYFIYYMKDNYGTVLFQKKISVGDWSNIPTNPSYTEKGVKLTPYKTYKVGCFIYNSNNELIYEKKDFEFKFRNFPTKNYDDGSAWASYYAETNEVVLSTNGSGHVGNYKSTNPSSDNYDSDGNPSWYLTRTKVKSLYICDDVANIGNYYFLGSQIEEIVFPKNTRTIEADAFGECKKLRRVYFEYNYIILKEGSFRNLDENDRLVIYAPCNTQVSSVVNDSSPKNLSDYCQSLKWYYYPLHSIAAQDKNTKCTSNVKLTGKCDKCRQTVYNYEIFQTALGHDYSSRSITKATTSKDGGLYAVCSHCGNKKALTVYKRISSVAAADKQITYNGRVNTPKIIVKDASGKTLVQNKDYKVVSYSSGRKAVGKYSANISFMGNYSGKATAIFEVVPYGTTIKSLSAKKGGFKASWKKQTSQTNGYEIQYSTTSSFLNAKAKTVKKVKTVSATCSKLKKGKKYYVRIRTFKKVGSSKFYSKWSPVKAVKVK